MSKGILIYVNGINYNDNEAVKLLKKSIWIELKHLFNPTRVDIEEMKSKIINEYSSKIVNSFINSLFGDKSTNVSLKSIKESYRDFFNSQSINLSHELNRIIIESLNYDYILVLGHSHGGMVISNSLKYLEEEHPHLKNKVRFWVFGCPVAVKSCFTVYQFHNKSDEISLILENGNYDGVKFTVFDSPIDPHCAVTYIDKWISLPGE